MFAINPLRCTYACQAEDRTWQQPFVFLGDVTQQYRSSLNLSSHRRPKTTSSINYTNTLYILICSLHTVFVFLLRCTHICMPCKIIYLASNGRLLACLCSALNHSASLLLARRKTDFPSWRRARWMPSCDASREGGRRSNSAPLTLLTRCVGGASSHYDGQINATTPTVAVVCSRDVHTYYIVSPRIPSL